MNALLVLIAAIGLTIFGLGGFDDFEKERGARKVAGKLLAIFCFVSIGAMMGIALAGILAS